MSVLSELQAAVATVESTAGGAVVRVGRGWGRGVGVVIDSGIILTNAHNVRGTETTVTFTDGRSVTAAVTGFDGDGDLAVLSADTGSAPSVAWAPETVSPQVGSAVFALTNPAGRGLRVTFGLISAVGQAFRGPKGRRIAGSVEHTAPLARGSSGGPIVDEAGRLVGLNTHRVGDGFYLAIPADADLKRRVDALTRGENPTRRNLGVALAPSQAAKHMRRSVGLPERDGLLVRAVQEGSPAESAGLRTGDLLVEAGGRALATHDDLFGALDGGGQQSTLEIKVVRGVDEHTVSVEFAPPEAPAGT